MYKRLLTLVTLTHTITAATIPFQEFKTGPLNLVAPFFNIATPSCPNPSPEYATITEEAENFAIRSLVTACLALPNSAGITYAIRQTFPNLTQHSLAYEILNVIFDAQTTPPPLSKKAQKRKRQTERQQQNSRNNSGDDLEDDTCGLEHDRPVFIPKSLRKKQLQTPLLPPQDARDHEEQLMKISLYDNIFAPVPAAAAAATAAASDTVPISQLKARVLRLYKELSEKTPKLVPQKLLCAPTYQPVVGDGAAAACATPAEDFISLDDFEPQLRSSTTTATTAATYATPMQENFISLDNFEPRQIGIESKAAAINILTIAWKKECERLETHLKENIIGQNQALEGFVWGIYNHYSRLIKETFANNMDRIGIPHLAALVRDMHVPSTILIVGPSGTGKTEMFRLAMEFLKLPSGTGSGALMTRAGYIGDKPEYIIEQLFQVAESKENAETNGVVFIDEVDKMAGAKDSGGGEFAEGAQYTLLTLIEGSQPIKISVKEQGEEVTYHVNTRGMLFILAGAFANLIPNQNSQQSAPFIITDSALVDYGMRPELINRVHRIIQTHPLSEDDFFRILMFKNSPLRQVMREYHEYRGVTVRFARDALDVFATHSVKQGLGARNLKRQIQGIVNTLYRRTQLEMRRIMEAICAQELPRKPFPLEALRNKRAEDVNPALDTLLAERERARTIFLDERAATLNTLQQKMVEACDRTLTITKATMETYLREMAPRRHTPPGFL